MDYYACLQLCYLQKCDGPGCRTKKRRKNARFAPESAGPRRLTSAGAEDAASAYRVRVGNE